MSVTVECEGMRARGMTRQPDADLNNTKRQIPAFRVHVSDCAEPHCLKDHPFHPSSMIIPSIPKAPSTSKDGRRPGKE